MDTRQMSTLCEIMRTGSVSEAARNLGRTQPAVSHILARLEDEIGMPLFERRQGRLHPVPEAEYLYRQCRDILQTINDVKSTMRRIRDVEEGEIQIVSMPGPTVEFLPSLISQHLGNRGVRAAVYSRSSQAVHRLIDAQQYDIGVADALPDALGAQTRLERRFRLRRVCAVAADHPLARKDVVGLKDISDYPLAALFPEHSTTRELSDQFSRIERVPDYRFLGQFFLPVLHYVRETRACAVVDPIAMGSWRRACGGDGSIAFRPFEPRLSFDVDILMPRMRPQSKLTDFFIERLMMALEMLELGESGRVGEA